MKCYKKLQRILRGRLCEYKNFTFDLWLYESFLGFRDIRFWSSIVYFRDLKECAYASKYISFPNTNLRQNTNKSSYGRTISTDIRDEDIDLVPKRRAPLPPNQMTYTSSSAMISEVHKSPVRRPTEPPPPAPSIARMGSSFKSWSHQCILVIVSNCQG